MQLILDHAAAVAWARVGLQGGRSALRVPHSTETHGPEEATLAEGAGIAANIPRSFTACPQGDAVRRRRRWLPLEFVLGGQNITKMSFFKRLTT